MKKYFFFDIDGTLTTPLTADYPESTRAAVKELIRRGHFVSLATGRMQADALEVARTLGISALVSDGGNAVTIDGKILYDEGLPLSDCIRTLSDIDEEKHPWAAAPYNKKYRVTRTPLYLEKSKTGIMKRKWIPPLTSAKSLPSTRFLWPAANRKRMTSLSIRCPTYGSARTPCSSNRYIRKGVLWKYRNGSTLQTVTSLFSAMA